MILQNGSDTIKCVGINGQISLGKEYAGKQVQISKLDDGTIIIRPGRFIPTSEQWLYSKQNWLKLEEAIEWVESNQRQDNFEEIESMIEND